MGVEACPPVNHKGIYFHLSNTKKSAAIVCLRPPLTRLLVSPGGPSWTRPCSLLDLLLDPLRPCPLVPPGPALCSSCILFPGPSWTLLLDPPRPAPGPSWTCPCSLLDLPLDPSGPVPGPSWTLPLILPGPAPGPSWTCPWTLLDVPLDPPGPVPGPPGPAPGPAPGPSWTCPWYLLAPPWTLLDLPLDPPGPSWTLLDLPLDPAGPFPGPSWTLLDLPLVPPGSTLVPPRPAPAPRGSAGPAVGTCRGWRDESPAIIPPAAPSPAYKGRGSLTLHTINMPSSNTPHKAEGKLEREASV